MSTSRTGLRRLTIESQIVPTSCYKPFNDPQRVILEYLIIARDKNQKIDLIAKQFRYSFCFIQFVIAHFVPATSFTRITKT